MRLPMETSLQLTRVYFRVIGILCPFLKNTHRPSRIHIHAFEKHPIRFGSDSNRIRHLLHIPDPQGSSSRKYKNIVLRAYVFNLVNAVCLRSHALLDLKMQNSKRRKVLLAKVPSSTFSTTNIKILLRLFKKLHIVLYNGVLGMHHFGGWKIFYSNIMAQTWYTEKQSPVLTGRKVSSVGRM